MKGLIFCPSVKEKFMGVCKEDSLEIPKFLTFSLNILELLTFLVNLLAMFKQIKDLYPSVKNNWSDG